MLWVVTETTVIASAIRLIFVLEGILETAPLLLKVFLLCCNSPPKLIDSVITVDQSSATFFTAISAFSLNLIFLWPGL